MFCRIFATLLPPLVERYRPGGVVLQVGADCITGDPLGGFNITPVGLGRCVKQVTRGIFKKSGSFYISMSSLHQVVDVGLPSLVLGGGGYLSLIHI